MSASPANDMAPQQRRGSAAASLVFVGGTGRSGTHVLSYLLDRHSRFHGVPIECRFHCNPKGLADLVRGETDPADFLRKLRGYWWHRVRIGDRAYVKAKWRALGRGGVRGLHTIVGEAEFAAAADGLARIFPEARFVHSVRDGRDSGSSKVALRQKSHHPTDVISGIDFWADRLRQAERGVRGLADADRSRLHVVSLDELVWGDREAAYAGLTEFLGVDDEPAMREFFDSEMNSGSAHRERWRKGLSESEQAGVVAHYEATLERFEADGYHCASVIRRSYERELAAQGS